MDTSTIRQARQPASAGRAVACTILICGLLTAASGANATEPLLDPATRTSTPAAGPQRDLGTQVSPQPATAKALSAAGVLAGTTNPIVAENNLMGNPSSEWDVDGAGDPTIQGFATDISVDRGQTIGFKIDTTAPGYRLDIYRVGYYGGAGARHVATIPASQTLAQQQPDCLTDSGAGDTGLTDCGNWSLSASWSVPADTTSGIYFARAVRSDTGGASHIVFIVRDDTSTSDLLFQTSDTTWQAYNEYGGNSLYTYPGEPAGRAYKVSYNRPFVTREGETQHDWLFYAEYPMVRWLEANGYDVSYSTGIDSARNGTLIRNHKVFLSVGHDEYWSGDQRANVQAARDARVHLAFFSGNEVFWKTRWEPSIDGSGQAYRTLVCYKETHANAKIDPTSSWTGTWRDPRWGSPPEAGFPENELTGTMFAVNEGATTAIKVTKNEGVMRFWRDTQVATRAAAGNGTTLAANTLGYEWDVDADNGFRPAGVVRLSKTTVKNAPVLTDWGSTYGTATAIHQMTLYKAASGALVFGGGTVQWSWGLDKYHDGAGPNPDARMQQATVNLLADMGIQPASLQASLVAAAASTDDTPPSSAIVSPAPGAKLTPGRAITISGTASDTGGGVVGGVEVSVDGGASWHPATGYATWTYKWTPRINANVTLLSRAVDDSANIEAPGSGVAVTVGTPPTPLPNGAVSFWNNAALPTVAADPDTGGLELGLKFTADTSGSAIGMMFYKGSTNTGTHVGSLWSADDGTLLAQGTFSGETTSGWQQLLFAAPATIQAGETYTVSYHTTVGHYAVDEGYFDAGGIDAAPLHAPAGGNGVYAYVGAPTLPTSTWNGSNYWVDVMFVPDEQP